MSSEQGLATTALETTKEARIPTTLLRPRRFGRRLVILIYQVIVAIAALAIWQACATWKLLDPTVISSPGAVFGYLFGDAIRGSELWTNFYYTMVATIISFVVGSAAGIAVGLVCVQFPVLEEVFDPFVTLMNSYPRIALAPLFDCI